jgi:hypothetical protein
MPRPRVSPRFVSRCPATHPLHFAQEIGVARALLNYGACPGTHGPCRASREVSESTLEGGLT